MASRLDLDAAENGMRLLFGGLRQFVVAQRHQPFGFLRCRDPHHAAAVAGQRHEHAGSLRRMKLGGDISMRPRMADVEGQRGLIEVAALDLDAGGLAAQRMPSVGADHKARRQRLSLAGADSDIGVFRADRLGLIVEPRQVGKLGGALLPAPPSASGFRCCSRTASRPISSDENRTSGARIRRPVSSTSRIVCNAAALSWQRGQTSSAFQKIDGAAQQRRGAIVGIGRAAGDQGGAWRRFAPARSRRQVRRARRRSRRRHKLAMHRSYRDN